MPLYEYECDAQQHRFEVIQKFADAPIAVCPTCGSSVHKLMSAPAFQLKGTGWYVTDYAKKESGTSDAKNASNPAQESASPAAEKGDKGNKGEKGEKSESAPNADAAPPPPASSDKSGSDKNGKD